jgi:uncharacterized protein with HEPN domain
MLDAAEEAVSSAKARRRHDLETDRIWSFGLVKCIEIIGEAASRVSGETRAQAARIPWDQVVGMRNRLVHAYFDIDLDQVWSTVSDDLPALIEVLRQMLAEDP